VSHGTQAPGRAALIFAYGALTRSGRASQRVRLTSVLFPWMASGPSLLGFQPRVRNGHHLGTDTVWAVPRSLTTTWGISVDFYSSGY
jgi:hypothetical protein